jgi:hypothetical protein
MTVHDLKEHDPVARIHFCKWFLLSVRDGEGGPHLVFFPMKPDFPCMGRWILRTVGIEEQKIQDLFTNFLFMMKKLVFGVW